MQVIDNFTYSLDEKNFKFYQGFLTEEAAKDFKLILDESSINSILEATRDYGEKVILGSVQHFPFVIKVLQSDFHKIPDAIKVSISKLPQEYFDEHPLNDLSTSELVNIIEGFSGNALEEFYTSVRILENRGIEIEQDKINKLITSNSIEMSKGKYISFSRLFSIFLVMILGVIINWIVVFICALIFLDYIFEKSYNSFGTKFYSYHNTTRKFSLMLLLIGLLINILAMVFLYYYHFSTFTRFFNTPYLNT